METVNLYRPESKEIFTPLLFHHSRPVESVVFGVVHQVSPMEHFSGNSEDGEMAQDEDKRYKWLEGKVGFYPLFLSVGADDASRSATGYQNQWYRELRGNHNNRVMFSYRFVPEKVVFIDSDWWDIIIARMRRDVIPTKANEKSLFKPSWSDADWLAYADKKPLGVQMVVPSLDLSRADAVWVRNGATKRHLEKMGFGNVTIQRLKKEII